jgi:hypothetical protein
VSGIEISRISTSTVASEPSAIVTRLSGMLGGSSMPASRRIAITTSASPRKNTSFPIVPVCQPITERVGPSIELPEYQDMNEDSRSTSPATHATRWPADQIPPAGRSCVSGGRAVLSGCVGAASSVSGSSKSKRSGVSTGGV